jgi:uncharacterized membrane protein
MPDPTDHKPHHHPATDKPHHHPPSDKPHRHLPRPLRIVRARPRLFLSILVGVVAFALTPPDWRLAVRVLSGWNIMIALYLALAMRMMAAADVRHIRRRARLQDEGQYAILALAAIAALASLGAIVSILGATSASERQPIDLLLGILTILLSWFFTHIMFALHYAHEFYDENGGRGGGLLFPGDLKEPDYWDFVYFSFVIGMTNQVSDVAITCRPIRHTVSVHGIISFFFNVALLALTINIAASAI